MRYLLCLALAACATFPQPRGEPGPLACVSAKSAEQAWTEVDRYIRELLAAQVAYSCGPLAPPSALIATPPPVVPPLR